MEIICISCWRAFDHDASAGAGQVTCPHCGFSQPGPDPASLNAKLDANTRPSEAATAPPPKPAAEPAPAEAEATSPEITPPEPAQPAAPAAEAPADATTPEITPPAPAAPPTPAAPSTEEFGAAPATPPQSPSAPPPDAAPVQQDTRWRLRTPAMLVLFFPDYEALSRYLTGDEGVGYAVACGPGPFRTLTGFTNAMRVTDDPLEALVNVQPAGDDVEIPQPAPAARPRTGGRKPSESTVRPQSEPDIAKPTSPSTQDDPATPRTRTRTRRRRTAATTDFTFRKAQEQNVWPGRLLFLVLGLLAGGAAIYYVAWIGLLPGIVY